MNKITAEKLYDFRFISNLSFNEATDRYAYQLSKADKEKNKYFSTVYVNEKKMTEEVSSSIVGWKDNVNLIITEDREESKKGYTELYLLNTVTGEKSDFLTLPLALTGLRKINDNLFVLTAGINSNEPDNHLLSAEEYEEKIKQLEKEKDYQVIDEVPYYFNGRGYVNKKRTALFTLQLEPFELKRITEPYFNAGDLCTEKNMIYFAGNSYRLHQGLYERLYSYNTDNGELKCLYDRDDMFISNVLFINGQLTVLGSAGKEFGVNETSKFFVYQDGELILQKKIDRSMYSSVATDVTLGGGRGNKVANGYFYTLVSDVDHVALWRFDQNYDCRVLFQMPLISFFDVCDDRIIFAAADEKSLPELYEYDFSSGQINRITSHNDEALKDCYVAKPQEITYFSNGWQLNGWVLLPEDFDAEKKYPAVLDIHGGPRAMYSRVFFHEMQLWAAEGYIVMFTNIHGSDGRGDRFADIRGRYGYEDYGDLMAFVDEVIKAYPQIDVKRICETGGSYGGFMTNWIIGHTDRFCAVASQRSISNWIGFTYLSDIGPYFSTDQNNVTDFINGVDDLWEHSPLRYVDNVKTPTLFIHSDEDYRCPLEEGMQMMQALACRGVETRMVIFHGENHELSRSGKPEHRIRRLKEITDWFNKHTKV